jgi:hypothetical protein
VLAPIIAGFLFQAGNSLPRVSLFLSVGSLFAILALWLLRMPSKNEIVH